MKYNGEASQAKIIFRKARSFVKGGLEGFLGTFVLPTMARKEANSELYKGDYRDGGRLFGSLLNLGGHVIVFNYLSDEKNIWAFAPIMATNAVSGAYELGRQAYIKIKGRKKEENEK